MERKQITLQSLWGNAEKKERSESLSPGKNEITNK